MPAIRTIMRPVNDTVTINIPEEYRTCSLEVIVLPIMDDDFTVSQFSIQEAANKSAKRKLGGFEEGFYMASDFDAPLEEFAAGWGLSPSMFESKG